MYVYGRNVAKELLKSKAKIKKIYIAKNFDDNQIKQNLENLNVVTLEKYELDKMTKERHQGIILEISDYKYTPFEDILNSEVVVILDHIVDPHNLGAIIRTSEAAGVNAIIIPKNRSTEVNATVMKTSSGSLENIKVSLVTNISTTIEKLKKQGFWIIGTDMEGTNYKKIDYSGKICIIIGSEENGMARIVKEKCDFIATINMSGKVNSLNASVASGIVIFEAMSQRMGY